MRTSGVCDSLSLLLFLLVQNLSNSQIYSVIKVRICCHICLVLDLNVVSSAADYQQ